MPTSGDYTLFRLRGIPIGAHWSWFLVLFLFIWFLSGYFREHLDAADDAVEPYALAVVTSLLFFGSILLHELGHAIVALRNGIGISHITLWLFGGVAGLERDSRGAGEEFRIAAAGPAVTLAIVGVCFATGAALEGAAFFDGTVFDEDAEISGAVLMTAWLGYINAIIFAFNLLPAFPLDGGRIARAIAWRITGNRESATGFAANLGQVFAFIFIAGGLAMLFLAGDAWGIWLAVIGWLLGQSARATAVRNELSKRIGDVSVADVMDADPVAIPANLSVEQALDEYFLRYQWPWFPVVDAGRRFLGVLKRGAADGVPALNRGSRQVAELLDEANEDSRQQRVRDDEPLEVLLGNQELRRLGALVAIDSDGRLSGVITLEQVGRALREAVTPGLTGDEPPAH